MTHCSGRKSSSPNSFSDRVVSEVIKNNVPSSVTKVAVSDKEVHLNRAVKLKAIIAVIYTAIAAFKIFLVRCDIFVFVLLRRPFLRR